jgi:hypothetical protein
MTLLTRDMRRSAILFCCGVLLTGVLIAGFTTRPRRDKDRIVHGFIVRDEIRPLISPTYTTADALRDAEFDSFRVWTAVSIVIVHVVLVMSWLLVFVGSACFVTLFIISRRLPAPPSVARGK